MGDLILKTRLHDLIKNLGEVQSVLVAVQAQRQEIDHLWECLNRQESSRRDLVRSLKEIELLAEPLAYDKDSDAAEFATKFLGQSDGDDAQANEEAEAQPAGLLGQAQAQLRELQRLMGETRKVLEQMQGRFTQIPENSNLKSTLENMLLKYARDWANELQPIAQQLEQVGVTPQEQADIRRRAWQDYISGGFEGKRAVFAEYADFLGGLALRDIGFDRGICRLADELILNCSRSWPSDTPPWQSLTIPTSQETMSKTLAELIRMGFPEWTFWAIPLTAHALGQVLVGKNTALMDYVKQHAQDKQAQNHLQSLLADAFATYVMGPAYACAAVMLRFNPVQACTDQADHPADAKRAHMVFTMLQRMNEQKEYNQPYEHILHEVLEPEWQEALRQVRPPAAAADQAGDAPPAVAAVVQLSEDEQKQLNAHFDYIANYLDKTVYVSYKASDLATTKELLGKLIKNPKLEDKELVGLQGEESLRNVYNAAWVYRVEHPDKSKDIQTAARRLLTVIADKGRRAGGERPKSKLEKVVKELSYETKGFPR